MAFTEKKQPETIEGRPERGRRQTREHIGQVIMRIYW
ncbi:hypothetical protein FHX15_001282 [Rhizobium sp. BK650]|nr:hypothetical protein [Rhizobium sp. BK650]